MKKVFLSLLVLLMVIGLVISGFSFSLGSEVKNPRQYNSPLDYRKATGKKIISFKEAPMLAELVKQGKLPPVEKRLPKNPVVVEVVEEIGQYGGTWRRAWLGPSDAPGPNKIGAYVRLVRYTYDGKKLENDLVDSWKMSKDGRTFTFHIREGIKWSDGTPFTTEDVIFWYKDILLNKDLTPTLPEWLTMEGKPPIVEKIDSYTFTVTFSKPYPIFVYRQAYYGGFYAPKHYLSQFHPSYVSADKLKTMAKEANFEFWYQLFSVKNNWQQNPDLPVLYSWRVISFTPARMIMERNPYFYKIDPEGNQLPYIDRVVHDLVQNKDMVTMKAIAGEIDMQQRHIEWANYTLFMENQKKGDYRIIKWIDANAGSPVLYINQNVKDEILRKLFRDRNFRIALSIAIDRNAINQLIFLGLGKPRQAAVVSMSPYFDPGWEKAYAEYNPEEANRILDKLGLKKGPDGIRLRPDGKPLEVTIEFASGVFGPWEDVLNMVKNYWGAIGIKVALKPQERALYNTRCNANEVQIGVWDMRRVCLLLINPDRLLGTAYGDSPWAPLWGMWYLTKGQAGEEPPAEVKKIFDLWERTKTAMTELERTRLLREIMNIHKKNIWMIGTVGEPPQLTIVKNNFRNVPEGLIWDDALQSPANGYPEQFFIKQK